MHKDKDIGISDLRAEIRGILEIGEEIIRIVQSMILRSDEGRIAGIEERFEKMLEK